VLDGLLVDGLYYGAEKPGTPSSKAYVDRYERILHELVDQRRAVLAVAYTTDRAQVRQNRRRARAAGFIPYATVRTLDRLVPNQ
jgi:hypothetical protein